MFSRITSITRENIAACNVYDFFLVAPNIEIRSREVLSVLKPISKVCSTIYFDFENFHIGNFEKEEEVLRNFLDSKNGKILSGDNSKIMQEFSRLKFLKTKNIAIDITGFSIPDIFQIFFIMKNILGISQVDVYYTEPKDYVYEEGYFDSYHKFSRNRKYKPIYGYLDSGENEEEVLVILLGFDRGLAQLVSHETGREEDTEVLLKDTFVVNGLPSYSIKLKDISLLNNSDLIENIEREQIFFSAANNPFSTYNVLVDIHKKCGEKLFTICPIGSKPMALGACMYALGHKKGIKVTYPYYRKIKFDSDEKAGKMWRYTIYL